MTAAEYRKQAERLLTASRVDRITEEELQEADVWSRLAVSAAISEQKEATAR